MSLYDRLAKLAQLLDVDGNPPGGAPSGAAGGELAGTYPDPTVAASHSGSTHAAVAAAAQAAAESTAAGYVATHEGLSDPHPGYLTPTEGDLAYQPKDSDLTAIAALTTTSFGRSLLAAADAAALQALAGTVIGTNVQAYDAELAAIAGLVSAADRLAYFTGSGAAALATFTAAGRAILDDADAAAQRTTLGLAIGTNVEAWDADLDAIAALAPSNDDVVQRKAGAWANRTIAQLIADMLAGGMSKQTITLGPFYINDLPASATTQATLGYFNTATALSRNGNDIKMQQACYIVGILAVSDAARTGGTATVRARIAGTGTTFNSGAVVLDATNTTSDSSIVAHASGLAVTAGQTVGVDVVTSGWGPTTADLQIFLVISLD